MQNTYQVRELRLTLLLMLTQSDFSLGLGSSGLVSSALTFLEGFLGLAS
jgi:hypothetical protein